MKIRFIIFLQTFQIMSIIYYYKMTQNGHPNTDHTYMQKQNQPPIPLRTNIHRSPPLALDDPDKLPCIHGDVITKSHTLRSWWSSEVTDGEAHYRGGQLSERLPRIHPTSSSCSSSALGCPPTPVMGLICAPCHSDS